METTMAKGTVKWFNPTKGYGFIQPAGGGRDLFVHISAVERATGGMGFGVSLYGTNREPLMSASGQKQTLTRVQPMSALTQRADIR
jgi:'Cold-shock' DNA-binding domain